MLKVVAERSSKYKRMSFLVLPNLNVLDSIYIY